VVSVKQKKHYIWFRKKVKTAKKIMMHNESCSMSYLFYGRMEGGGRGVQMILLF
jgi:hypothetical protein